MKAALVVFVSLLGCWPAVADQSISELPKHIAAPPGEIALVADYDHPVDLGEKTGSSWSSIIPVYLINRSAKHIELPSQDGRVYLKLEYLDAKGEWKRAQRHRESDCGNSYDTLPAIRPEHFLVIEGYQPARGDKDTIRFRFYKKTIEAASNVGKGLVNRDEIKTAENDFLALRTGNLAFVASVARGERLLQEPPRHVSRPESQRAAIDALLSGRFDQAQVKAVLTQIIGETKEPSSSWAATALSQLNQKAGPKAGP